MSDPRSQIVGVSFHWRTASSVPGAEMPRTWICVDSSTWPLRLKAIPGNGRKRHQEKTERKRERGGEASEQLWEKGKEEERGGGEEEERKRPSSNIATATRLAPSGCKARAI